MKSNILSINPPPVVPRVVQAVGHCHMLGKNTINMDLRRFTLRQFCRIMYGSKTSAQAIGRLDKALRLAGFSNDWREKVCCFAWNLWPIFGAAKGGVYEGDILKLLFNATAIANIADNTATSPLTNIYVSLHTADPGTAGNQQTSEVAYTSYARVAVIRDNTGWTISGTGPASCSPAATISFPQGTGGSGTVSHMGIGSVVSATGKLFYSGTVTPNIITGNGVTPQLTTATTITES